MNELNIRDYGDFLATVNGARRCRVRVQKKGQPAGFHVSSDPANGNTSVPLSAQAQDFESARDLDVLSHGSLVPLTTFYLKFNLR